MGETVKKRPSLSCTAIFALCCLARLAEYFVVRTDETVLAENFLHKVFGVVLLAAVLRSLRAGWQSIGFTRRGAASGIAKGFALGGVCFAAAYLTECLALYCLNGDVSLSLYVSGFSLNGPTERHAGAVFLLLCVVWNLVNVWMEEGVFRGLFMKILSEKLPFANAALFIALLFGIWHWVMPFRDYAEGRTSLANLLIMGAGYVLLAGIMSIKWSLLYRMTGSLWTGLGDHLLNNVVVTNLLHVVSGGEADSLQIVRILLGQSLSFLLVMRYYKKRSQFFRGPGGRPTP